MKIFGYKSNEKSNKALHRANMSDSETFRASSSSSFGMMWRKEEMEDNDDSDSEGSTIHPLDRDLRNSPDLQLILQVAAAQEEAKKERRQRWRSYLSIGRSSASKSSMVDTH